MNQMMIDIETLSTKQNAVILQCAWVYFDDEGPLKSEISKEILGQNFIIDFNENKNRCIDKSTLKFWTKDENIKYFKEVLLRDEKIISLKVLTEVLTNSYLYMVEDYNISRIWSSENFDIPILQNVYESFGKKLPFVFRDIRGIRTATHGVLSDQEYETLKNIFVKENPKYIKHNAYWDCLWQIELLNYCKCKQKNS